MSFAVVHSRANLGIQAPLVTVETHISNGVPRFSIVGLPATAVKESKDRVRSALLNCRFEFPAKRITINLAPADLPKDGGRFDLPIALGILAATNQIPMDILADYEVAGELTLSGELRPIIGALPFALHTRKQQKKLIIPLDNGEEAVLPGDACVYGMKHLLEVCQHLTGHLAQVALEPQQQPTEILESVLEMSDIYGQSQAKRALEIAASGGHNILLIGPPGTGKTMLATRLASILPPLAHEQAMEVAALRSISGQPFLLSQWQQRPIRTPHHSASSVALVGGGSPPRPGEISLAHHGILFLDELPEFERRVLEALREPLESGNITISRAARQAEFPAQFQLVAAMNPCPCGYAGHSNGQCHCTDEQIQRYRARISGPLLDRIDMHIEVPALPASVLLTPPTTKGETSATILLRVEKALQQQQQRQQCNNAKLNNHQLRQHCKLDENGKQRLLQAAQKMNLSARACHRIIKVARTIADMQQSDHIGMAHITEAIGYRQL